MGARWNDLQAWWKSVNDEAWMQLLLSAGMRVAIALLALYIGIRLVTWASGLTSKAMTRARLEPTAALFLRKVIYVILLVVLVLAILQLVFGVAPTSLMAVIGAAGLAIGLALKDSLSNVASGVMLVSLKPFRVGDIVKIAGESGKVEAVSIFQTQLRGADNQLIVLPNSLITGDSIVNLTPDYMRRIELIVGISYSDDIDLARSTALEVIAADKRVLAEPAADVLVYALAESSVNLGIRCHVRNDDFFATKCELLERIKKSFDAAGLRIPYPQRDVHMYHHLAQGGDGSADLPLLARLAKPADAAD
jgi:small conductance mechanosensitive channel